MSRRSVSQSLFGRQNPAVLFLGPLLLFVSCEDKFMKQTTADKTAAIATLQTKLDDSGNHVASFDPTKSETQLMRITSGAIAGAAVAIPPAALSIPVSIAVGEGVSLATSSFSQNLGITDNKINAGGPSVSFTTSQDVVATNPMTLSIPFGSTSLNLNDADSDNIVVMYRWTTIENGETKFEAGILPGEKVTRAKNKVSFQTTKFGTFQVGVAEKKITAPVVAKTEEPPALKSCERYAAELFPSCTTHGQVGCVTSNAFRSVDMNFLKGEFILSTPSIPNLQGDVTLPLASQVRAGTQFGAAGNQFTGTFSLNSNNTAIKACERFTAAVYQPCAKDGQVGCVTTDAFKAADMTLIRPEIILAGRIIAGIAGTVILPTKENVIIGTSYGPTTASLTGTSFAAIPTLSYNNASGTRIKLGQTFSVSPTSFSPNGSNIISCGVQSGTTALPAGITVNQGTCAISGSPGTLFDPNPFKIVATNSVGRSTEADVTLAVLPTAATPTFSVAGGTYGPSQTVQITSNTNGAAIYYTIDGSKPTVALSMLYSSSVPLSASLTLRAIATKNNFFDSEEFTASYVVDSTPPSNPGVEINDGNSYTNNSSVTLTLRAGDATHMYLTNTAGCSSGGSWEAFASSRVWILGQTNEIATVYGKFKDAVGNETECVSARITHDTTAPRAPVISDASRFFNASFLTSIQQGVPQDANFKEFRYTTSGSNPTCSTGMVSSALPTSLDIPAETTTIKAISCDQAGHASPVVTETYTFDSSKPTATMTTTSPLITKTSPIEVKVTFSESVTGFTASDINVVNGTVTTIIGSGANYTVNVTLSNQGPVTINLPADVVLDLASNGNSAASPLTIFYDSVAPTVSISSDRGPGPTNSQLITIRVTFSEDVSGFTGSAIILTNASKSAFTAISAKEYTLKTIASGGVVSVSVPASSALDLASNANIASMPWSITYDITPPSIPNITATNTADIGKPTWTWSSSGGGNGTYRYKLDDDNLSTGFTETTLTTFKPATNLSDGPHTLYVQERDDAGNWSEPASGQITITTPPSPPNLSASQSFGAISLFWTPVTGETYTLYWANAAGVSTNSTPIPNVSSPYIHTNLTAGASYYYRVLANKNGTASPLSNETNGTPTGILRITPALSVINPDLVPTVSFGSIGGSGAISYLASTETGANRALTSGVLNTADFHGSRSISITASDSTSPTKQTSNATLIQVATKFNGPVNAMVTKDGFGYFGGAFTAYNSHFMNGLGKINSMTGNLESGCNFAGLLRAATGSVPLSVNALAETATHIYVGGANFAFYADRPISNLIKIDKVTCRLDETFSQANAFSTNSAVNALSISGSSIFMGGNFTSYRNTSVGRLAKLDLNTGELQSFTLAGGFDDAVNTLSLSTTDLYVGGAFLAYGGVPAKTLAKLALATGQLDTTWSNHGIANLGAIHALAFDGQNLYVGGSFLNLNGQTAQNLAKLNTDGSVDSTFTKSPGFNGTAVRALLLNGQDLYVGGEFSSYSNTSVFNIAKLDRINGNLNQTFTQTGTGFFWGSVNALAWLNNSLYVGGSFATYRGFPAQGLAKLDPSDGSLDQAFTKDTGMNGPWAAVKTILTSGTSVYAGGNFTHYRGVRAPRLAKINLSTGVIDTTINNGLGSGFNNTVWALAIDATGLYVGGDFNSLGNNGIGRIAKIDLNNGVPLSPFPSNSNGFDNSVYSLLLSSSGHLYVGGSFTSYRNQNSPGLVKLDLSSGVLVSGFPTNGFTSPGTLVNAILESGSHLFVGGKFNTYSGLSSNNIVKIDQSTGARDSTFTQSTGFDYPVTSLATDGTSLFVGGKFTTYRGTNVQNIAKLDLSNGNLVNPFHATQTGFNDVVSSLAINGSSLYVGGNFTTYRGNSNVQRLAKIDTTSGQLDTTFTQGGGFNGLVSMLSVSGTSLIVSGSFSNYRGTDMATISPFFTTLDLTYGNPAFTVTGTAPLQ